MSHCSCGTGKKTSSVEELFDSPNKRREMAELTYLKKDLFIKGDKYSFLKFLYCADEQAFIKAFSEYEELDLSGGVSDDDLKTLAKLWESGKDKEMGFDIKGVVVDMKISYKKLATCSVKFL